MAEVDMRSWVTNLEREWPRAAQSVVGLDIEPSVR